MYPDTDALAVFIWTLGRRFSAVSLTEGLAGKLMMKRGEG